MLCPGKARCGVSVESTEIRRVALEGRERKLADVKAQLEAAAQPASPAGLLLVMTEDDVRRRLGNLWKEIKGADRDRARDALSVSSTPSRSSRSTAIGRMDGRCD